MGFVAMLVRGGLSKAGLFVLVGLAIYAFAFTRGRVHEARVTGAAHMAAQLDARAMEIETLKATIDHSARERMRLADELETKDAQFDTLKAAARSDDGGHCRPFTDGQLREFNALLGHAGPAVPAGRSGSDTGSGEAAATEGLAVGQWALECARRYSRARAQMKSLRNWFATSPQFRKADRKKRN